MRACYWLGLLVLAVLLAFAGCKGGESKGSAEKQYPIKGKVVSVDPSKPAVKLDHEDIPGLMRGMEMEFVVEDGKILQDIKTGDQVQGRLKVEAGQYIITQLEKAPAANP
jgi:protein SCO1/2